MNKLLLLDSVDVQQALADYLRQQRKKAKLSRAALAERSGVPAATIKKFELSGQISLRQWLILWECVDDLKRLYALTQDTEPEKRLPSSIEEVLNDEF